MGGSFFAGDRVFCGSVRPSVPSGGREGERLLFYFLFFFLFSFYFYARYVWLCLCVLYGVSRDETWGWSCLFLILVFGLYVFRGVEVGRRKMCFMDDELRV